MRSKIKPSILRGTRDFLPEEIIKRDQAMKIFKRIFEKYGYVKIETPILNPAETILGKYGNEGEKLSYVFEDRGGKKIALPYDLTVPFARYFAANYHNLTVPFKRYQMQRVWRAERPQKGRLREFYQCDIDTIGTNNILAEAELVRIIYDVFTKIGVDEFTIKFNSRKLINSVLRSFKISPLLSDKVIRTLDKIEKIGKERVINELNTLGLDKPEKIISILERESSNEKTIDKLIQFDVEEIQELLILCKNFQIKNKILQFDPTLARGLDYYTGLIFEVVEKENEFGTLCAGGRYDNLCGLFSERNFSGVGVSFGFERIMMAIGKKGSERWQRNQKTVLVTLFDSSPESIGESIKIYRELIKANIKSELYLDSQKLSRQFNYADKKGFQFVLVRGENERKNNEITVKNMRINKQKTIPFEQLTHYIKGFFSSN